MVALLRLILLFALLVQSPLLFAQEKCGTVSYQESLKKRNLVLSDEAFEQWLSEKISKNKLNATARTAGPPYVIPVVVHVIHNGEPVGVGTNISNTQIQSQIKVLNEDFQRLNDDATQTPPVFASVAAGMQIEFVLAKQDPEGLATNGIVRVQGTKNGWTSEDNYELKAQSYWPAEDYLNVWVCDLVDELVGYAQLPQSDIVGGLEDSQINRLTDGVVVWYRAFGSVADGAFSLDPSFNRGRTATHEVGHFFGLRHIWGDDSGLCSGTDFVNDTPNQSGSTNGCPSHPNSDPCGGIKMFQNYMDYTNDACMNLFTAGQVNRMIAILDNSPRRESLTTSRGAQVPVSVANDLGIRRVVRPGVSQCETSFKPALELRNYGTNTITSAQVIMRLNGAAVETKTFTLSLQPFQVTTLEFSTVNLTPGDGVIEFEILTTNGGADGYAANNIRAVSFDVPETVTTPFAESFNTFPPGWQVENPDGLTTWAVVNAPRETPNNTAIALVNYNYTAGEYDALISPVFSLANANTALLRFDVAYARRSGRSDELKVLVLTDCEDLRDGNEVYTKSGAILATAGTFAGSFVPSSTSQWREELIDLSAYLGQAYVRLAFVGVSGGGNNIYLDDISMATSDFENLALKQIVSPSFVTCDNNPPLLLRIQNAGSPIEAFSVQVKNGATTIKSTNLVNLSFTSGAEQTFDLGPISLQQGPNNLTVELSSPNGTVDVIPQDNILSVTIIVDATEDRAPLRERFESPSGWILGTPTGGMSWEKITTNFGTSVYFNAFDNTLPGQEAWLVSPVLDFSAATDPSLSFNLSHRTVLNRKEELTLMVSTDCGNTYEPFTVSYNSSARASEWTPQSTSDWQLISVPLPSLAGEEDVRLALVVTNRNGNNMYIDNIEIFTTIEPLFEPVDPYTIYGYAKDEETLAITFNLERRQDVRYSIVDLSGRFHADGILFDALNQTYPLELESELAPGIYVVRVTVDGRFISKKILIKK